MNTKPIFIICLTYNLAYKYLLLNHKIPKKQLQAYHKLSDLLSRV